MSEVKVRRVFRQPAMRCQAAEVGELVAFLRNYTDVSIGQEIERRTADDRARLEALRASTDEAQDTHLSRLRAFDIDSSVRSIERITDMVNGWAPPRWTVVTRVGRHNRTIEAKGDYDEISSSLDLERARSISVRLGSPGELPSFNLAMDRSDGVELTVECDDPLWLDDETPRFEARLRALNRGPWRWVRRPYFQMFGATMWVVGFIISLFGITNIQAAQGALIIMLIAAVLVGIGAVPALTIGTKPPQRLLRILLWLGATVVTGFIGAVIGQWLFPH